ncbi:hypothetical protein M9Y10_006801 [Tritrichomonas musculus]|uniref:Protein kinase domain-containing protein n=1 Tax=Tritrichomonas musculus TaxID=1915356 RepID=A0ABR2JF54_9EUKA
MIYGIYQFIVDKTALDYSILNNHSEIVEYLKKGVTTLEPNTKSKTFPKSQSPKQETPKKQSQTNDNQRIRQLEEENSQMKSQISQLEEENSQMKSQNSQMKSQISQLEEENSQMKSQNSQMKSQISQLEEENSQMKSQISQLEEENSQMKSQISQLEEENSQMKSQNSQMKSQNEKIDDEISQLKDKNQKLRGFLMALKNKPAKVVFYNPEDYREDSIIGEGATSCVKSVIKEEKYAKKELKNFTQETARGFMRESEILFRVHHPCIIEIVGMNYGDEKHPPSLILSFEETSLESAIEKDEIDDKQKCLITVQIVLGMRYIHLRGFMHRDLKPSNILLNKEYEVRISDFGLAREDNLETSQSKGIGTLRFMAPELLAEDEDDDDEESGSERKAKYTNKVDVYSFGVTLIFIMTGNYPKFNMLKMAQGVTPRLPSSVPKWVRELITRCLSLSAESRPSFAEIFEIMKSNNYDLFSDSKDVKLPKKQQQMKKEIEECVLKIEGFEFQHQNDQVY